MACFFEEPTTADFSGRHFLFKCFALHTILIIFIKTSPKRKTFLEPDYIMLKTISMYKFIPLNTHSLSMIKSINDKANNIFVCGTDTYTALCNYERYPLKNTTLAIKNILEFLQHVDTLITKDNIVSISSRIIRKIFTGEQYTAYLHILSELKIINRVPYDDGLYYEQKKRYCRYYIHHNYRVDKVGLVIANTTSVIKLSTDKKYPAKFQKAIRYTECDFASAIASEYNNYMSTGMSDDKLRKRLS